MKGIFSYLVLWAFAATASFAGETPADALLITFTQERTNAVRITKNPVRMDRLAASLCAAAPVKPPGDPHYSKYAHVYVSAKGAPVMQATSGVFPEGTIILKEKFNDQEGKHTELFTGMVKREPGYNAECGDWEFFILPADGKKIFSRGKLQNCMDCHVEYKASDFVTKNYTYLH